MISPGWARLALLSITLLLGLHVFLRQQSANHQLHRNHRSLRLPHPQLPATIPPNNIHKTNLAGHYASFNPGGQYILLTFSHGPHHKNTGLILDILKTHNVSASFFVYGRAAMLYKNVIKRMADEGHGKEPFPAFIFTAPPSLPSLNLLHLNPFHLPNRHWSARLLPHALTDSKHTNRSFSGPLQ